MEEFKNQNMILKGLVNESGRKLPQTNEILTTQDKVAEFSPKCTKDLTHAMYKMLKTRFTMVVSEEASAELHNLFVKLEGDMYKMHEQFIETYQTLLNENSRINNDEQKNATQHDILLFVVCMFIFQILVFVWLLINI